MATQIKLRRDTYTNWYNSNPVLGAGEPGYDTTNSKLKIGDGTTAWRTLPYFDDKVTDFSAVSADIIPATDNTYSIGSPDKRWQHGYFANGSLYVGDIKLSNNNGTLKVQQVTDAGLETEAEVNVPGIVTTDRIVNNNHTFVITSAGGLELDGSPFTGGSGTPGADGASAYQVAVTNGFNGTELQWLASLVGPKGDTGDRGYTGSKGDPGDPGAKGDPGSTGQKGDTGAQGVSVTLQGTKATIADLPAAPQDPQTFAGHGWIVTTGDGLTHLDGSLWFWNIADQVWNDIGPIVGPQGDKGDKGDPGDTGPKGDPGTSNLPTDAVGVLTNDGTGNLTWSSGVQLTTETLDSYVAFNQRTNPTLTLGLNTGDVTITQAASDVDHRGDRKIRIQGARGYGSWSNTDWAGDGGTIQIYGGLGGETGGDLTQVSGGEGGNIEIFGGDGQCGRDGGDINIWAGQARMSNGSPNNVTGGHIRIIAGSGTDSNAPGKGFGGNVTIQAGNGQSPTQHGNVSIITPDRGWTFNNDGTMWTSTGTYTKAVDHYFTTPGSEVVWTSVNQYVRSAKLLIQLECAEDASPNAPGWELQTAEAVIAYRGVGEPIMTVYGVTYTSTVPLMTFAVQRNLTTNYIEIVATRTAATTDAAPHVRIHSVEITTTN